MILVALGSNINSPWGTADATLLRALDELVKQGIDIHSHSRLIITSPYGFIQQPDFTNLVAIVKTHLPAEALMWRLHAIERQASRHRTKRWGPRTLDLDLLDYHGLIKRRGKLILPHPGIAHREFVLKPIMEIAPFWRHTETHLSARDMLKKLNHRKGGHEI